MATARLSSKERRAAILDAAVQLFSEKGFRGVTTRELAAAVGVTEPVLYQHFETKRDLYKALIEERAVAGDRVIPTRFEGEFAPKGDDREFLIELANGIIDWHTSDPAYIRLLTFSALEGHELSDIFFENYSKAFFEQLAAFFRQRAEEGAFRSIDPMIAAHTFVGMAGSYGRSRVIFQRCFERGVLELPQEQIVEGFVDIFLEGIRKRS